MLSQSEIVARLAEVSAQMRSLAALSGVIVLSLSAVVLI
jgi:hypothetical protein